MYIYLPVIAHFIPLLHASHPVTLSAWGLSAFLCPTDMVPDRGVYIGKESILQNVLSAKGVCARSLRGSEFIYTCECVRKVSGCTSPVKKNECRKVD